MKKLSDDNRNYVLALIEERKRKEAAKREYSSEESVNYSESDVDLHA